ncbi:MAG: hypothetical protein R6U89_06750 [Dehalococcoidia bacterium]
MKSEPTPVPFPASESEMYKWGFDVYPPEGTPMAWIMDWTSASPGAGISERRVSDLLKFKLGIDLSEITVDEVMAALSMRLKMQFHGMWKNLEDGVGQERALETGRENGLPHGEAMWKNLQRNFGSPIPLDKIAWYQDITHLMSGPGMRPYSWFDERKAVCTRERCAMRPPKGMERYARYCRNSDNASIEGYMMAEPDLLCVRVPDLGDEAQEPRCVHMWTYDREVIERLPDDLKERIPETSRDILHEKGVRL